MLIVFKNESFDEFVGIDFEDDANFDESDLNVTDDWHKWNDFMISLPESDVASTLYELETIADTVVDVQEMVDLAALLKWNSADQKLNKKKDFGKSSLVSARTIRRQKQTNREMAKGSEKITKFFKKPEEPSTSTEESEASDDKLTTAIESLQLLVAPKMNKQSDQAQMGTYELARLQAVLLYLEKIDNGKKPSVASREAALDVWKTPSKFYRARAIRTWAKEYLEHGSLQKHQQGKHAKRSSILTDNDVKERAVEWFRAQSPSKRTIESLIKYIKDEIFPEVLSSASYDGNDDNYPALSTYTVAEYLRKWGFTFKLNSKSAIYFDGHERQDVKEYRLRWAREMVEWSKSMDQYPYGDEQTVITPLIKEGEKKIVLVTHDESIFYANDGKKSSWTFEGESRILPKGQGRSIMISEFMCPCHGTMRGTVNGKEEVSRVVFYPGGDNWWTCADLNDQLKNTVVPLFELLHPGCVGLFAFDQSQNHKAFASDALMVNRMTSGEVEVTEKSLYKFRDGYYFDKQTRAKISQSMYEVRSFNRRALLQDYKKLSAQKSRSNQSKGSLINELQQKHYHGEVYKSKYHESHFTDLLPITENIFQRYFLDSFGKRTDHQRLQAEKMLLR